MRILLIEDEEGVVRFVSRGLKEEGFSVDSVRSAELALEQLKFKIYDLFILDIYLPQMSGFDFLSHFRQQDYETPVLILTAKDSIGDKRIGFQYGCDDYLTKPFHFEELLMRIRALLRKNKKNIAPFLQVGSLRLEPSTFKAFIGEEGILLTKKEFALLRYFMVNEGKVLSRTQLLNHVWQQSSGIGSNVVDVTINVLRKKIHRDEDGPKISTIHGIGYVFQNISKK